MPTIKYEEINFSELMTFLSVARTLNMSLSALELNISQPAVSKRIHHLETSHGLMLFRRTNTGLKLTPAGKVFYKEILESCNNIGQAIHKAAAYQATPIPSLTIGHDGFFDLPLLYEIISRFNQRHHIDVKMYTYFEEDCTDLFNGTADLMLCPQGFFSAIKNQVKHEWVANFNFYILISKEHPLAKKEMIGIPDLMGVPLTVAHMNDGSPYIAAVTSIFEKYGFRPYIMNRVMRSDLCMDIVINKGVTIASPRFWKKLDARTSEFFTDHIRICPISDAYYPEHFVWRSDRDDHMVEYFLEVYHEVISEGDNQRILHEIYD